MKSPLRGISSIFLAFFIFQILANLVLNATILASGYGFRAFLGWTLFFFVPFSLLGSGILIRERLHPIQMGLISLIVGVVDEIFAVIGGDGSLFLTGLFNLDIQIISLMAFLFTLLFWFGLWSVPSFFVYKYLFSLYNDIYQLSGLRDWKKSILIRVMVISTVILIAVMLYIHLLY